MSSRKKKNKKEIDMTNVAEVINVQDSKDVQIDDDSDQTNTNNANNDDETIKSKITRFFTELVADDAPNYKLIILTWISRLVPISAALIAFIYLIWLMANGDNWSTDDSSDEKEKLRREASRGVFVSVMIAILLNCIGAFMFYIKVRESLVVINYGFILGPVIGFMLDQAIGKDEGCKDAMTSKGFSYTFSSLIGGNFMRYIVTVFLDLFISNPLQDILKTQVAKVGVIKVLKQDYTMKDDSILKNKWLKKYDSFVAMNYPSILQSIVAFVTFNAYTNQTRFAWAYPNIDLSRELRIPPGTIMLSTAIAGVLYLNFYTIMDYISEREYFDVNTKLGYVLAILGLLYGLNQTDSIEAPVADEYDKEYTKSIASAKPYLGIMMFSCFVLYGFVYPVYTRMGCCGKCKPKESEMVANVDHLAEVDDVVPVLTQPMIDEIRRQVNMQLNENQNHGNQNQRNVNNNKNIRGSTHL